VVDLIIPALLFFANLPMKQAVGTSLLIFINSSIGFMVICTLATPNYSFLLVISVWYRNADWHPTFKKNRWSKIKTNLWLVCISNGMYIITKEIFFNKILK
jgi:hypothetical protein